MRIYGLSMLSMASGCGFGRQEQQIKNKCKTKDMIIFYQNVRGLRTKLDEFQCNLVSSSADIYAITETGLNNTFQNAEIVPQLQQFKLLRCDRSDGRKQGGAMLLSHCSYQVKRLIPSDVSVDSAVFEIVCSAVYKSKRLLYTLCVVYLYSA